MSTKFTAEKLDTLQWCAFACMVCDHMGLFIWSEQAYELRSIGRLAFPWFAWLFGYKLALRQSMSWIQLKRLFITGIICVPLFALLDPSIKALNIMFTFMCAWLLIYGYTHIHHTATKLYSGLAIVIGLFATRYVDYDYSGVLLIVSIYSWYRWKNMAALQTITGCLLLLTLISDYPFAVLSLPVGLFILNKAWTIRRSWPGMFYQLYPLHLMILLGLKSMLPKTIG